MSSPTIDAHCVKSVPSATRRFSLGYTHFYALFALNLQRFTTRISGVLVGNSHPAAIRGVSCQARAAITTLVQSQFSKGSRLSENAQACTSDQLVSAAYIIWLYVSRGPRASRVDLMPRFHEGVFGPMIEMDSIVAPNGLF